MNSLETVLEDGLLVVTAVGIVVYGYNGVGESFDAHLNHGGPAQVAVAHHTPFRHDSHWIDLNGTHVACLRVPSKTRDQQKWTATGSRPDGLLWLVYFYTGSAVENSPTE